MSYDKNDLNLRNKEDGSLPLERGALDVLKYQQQLLLMLEKWKRQQGWWYHPGLELGGLCDWGRATSLECVPPRSVRRYRDDRTGPVEREASMMYVEKTESGRKSEAWDPVTEA